MSAKELIYGVVATVVPNCTGVDGGTYTGYIVQKSHFGGTVLGHSIKDVSFVPGDVVRIVQCGENLTYGGTDVPLHGWGFLPYANDYPTVLQVPEYSIVRDIETNPKHAATASLNWLCRKAGCIDKLYWPARITGISGSLVTVCDQFGDGAYQMPVSSDLSISDFSIGDYVLVYSPSSGEEVIGWWMMEPGGAIITVSLSVIPSIAGRGISGSVSLSLTNNGNRAANAVTASYTNTAGAFINDLTGTIWNFGAIAAGETKTHTESITFLGNKPTTDGYSVSVVMNDTSSKTIFDGAMSANFSIGYAALAWDDFMATCSVTNSIGEHLGYIGTMFRDVGGSFITFAVIYDPPTPGYIYEKDLGSLIYTHGDSIVESINGTSFKIVFTASGAYSGYLVFDITVNETITVNSVELQDYKPTHY